MTTWELRSDPSAWKVWRQMSGSQPPCASRARGRDRTRHPAGRALQRLHVRGPVWIQDARVRSQRRRLAFH